jgi:hypothetical protein
VQADPLTQRKPSSPRLVPISTYRREVRHAAATGVFEAERTDLELFAAVGQVARALNPERPDRLSQPQFDRYVAAHQDEFPGVPSARAIYMRVNTGRQAHIGWKSIVRAACSSPKAARQTLVAARRSEFETPLTNRVVFFALNAVARRLGARSLTPGGYDDERQRIGGSKDRKHQTLALLLPTANQIESFVGDWDEALVIALLEPRSSEAQQPTERKPMGMDMSVAIGHYLEHHGLLPARAEIRRFAKHADFALSDPQGVLWEEHMAEFRARWTELGRWAPAGLPPREHQHLNPEQPGPFEGALRPIHTRWENIDDCAQAVLDYWDTLQGRSEPTQKGYGRWAVGKPYPAPSVFNNQAGGFTPVKERARELRRAR